MEVPYWFSEELRTLDPQLTVVWDHSIKRWKLFRKDPNLPSKPATLVKVVAEDLTGEYRPLDRRTISWLYRSDLTRRFAGRRQEFWGRLVEKAMAEEQHLLDKRKKQDADEMYAQMEDELAFAAGQDQACGSAPW